MVTVKEIYDFLAAYAPPERKMDFDNVGLLAGWESRPVTRVLVALDITTQVIDEAARIGAELIVSHHPMFFELKRVTDTDKNGVKALKLIENGISAICMHTNLDGAQRGVNFALANAIGMTDPQLLTVDGVDSTGTPYSYGRVGHLEAPVPIETFLAHLKKALNSNGLRYHDAGRPVYYVGAVGGSGGSDLEAAVAMGCDTFVTADVKYDVFLDAKYYGVNLIDADHFCTENTVVPVLREAISQAFAGLDVQISQCHGQTAQFY